MCKKYFIYINGEKITVSEEVYRAYMRPVWREKKFRYRNKKRNDKYAKSDGECSVDDKKRT